MTRYHSFSILHDKFPLLTTQFQYLMVSATHILRPTHLFQSATAVFQAHTTAFNTSMRTTSQFHTYSSVHNPMLTCSIKYETKPSLVLYILVVESNTWSIPHPRPFPPPTTLLHPPRSSTHHTNSSTHQAAHHSQVLPTDYATTSTTYSTYLVTRGTQSRAWRRQGWLH